MKPRKYFKNEQDHVDYDLKFRPLEVVIPPEDQVPEKFDIYVKKFRALVTKERIMSDLKEHQVYEKPSDKKRRRRREAEQRRRKMNSLWAQIKQAESQSGPPYGGR